MKALSWRRIFLLFLLCGMVISAGALMTGCGKDGQNGAAGANGQDATFGSSTCTACHHLDNSAMAEGLIQPAYGAGLSASAPTATAGTAVSIKAKSSFIPTGSTTTVNATGYYWQQSGGLTGTFTGAVTGATVTFTIASPPDYLGTLLASTVYPDRTMVIPVNSYMIEKASNAELLVYIFGDDGKIYFDIVLLKEPGATNALKNLAPRETTGLANVPLNGPVLLNAQGSDTLSLTTNPSTTATLSNPASKIYSFTPDVVGNYVVTDNTNSSRNITIYAGTWRGAIVGTDANNVPTPDGSCMVAGCHDNVVAQDNFTPWKTSGHAGIFSQNLNAGGHYGSSCLPCHTVGFKTGAGNNGFDLQPNYASFIADKSYFSSSTDNTRYQRMWASAGTTTDYSALAKETNIQCENCHGPQQQGVGTDSSAHMNVAGAPRVSVAAEVCGSCHGEPTRHGRFQQWQESPGGHANYSLAARGTSNGCPCHAGQGALVWMQQLVNGNPLRTIPLAKVTWNSNTVQPQTCAVCHDPHQEGTTSTTGPAYSDETVATNAPTRLSQLMVQAGLGAGDTPKLPTGYRALGVGKGAQCMICHNIREGGIGTTGSNGQLVKDPSGFGGSYLHEDNDPVFGLGPIGAVSLPSLTYSTSYASPHDFAQADVLMGHNAYFMGGSGGDNSIYRSPHASIVDTCVNCHMRKTPPPAELSNAYGGTNHTFKADLGICTDCHGVDPGLGLKLQADTQAMLDQVSDNLGRYIKTQATGTLLSIVTSAGTTTLSTAIPFSGNIYSISPAKSTSTGAQSVTGWDITLKTPSGLTVPAITSTSTTTVGIQVYGSTQPVDYVAAMVTTSGSGAPGLITIANLNVRFLVPLPLDRTNDFVLNKSIWNYQLIQRDYSLGVHNPTFIRNVLTETNDALLQEH